MKYCRSLYVLLIYLPTLSPTLPTAFDRSWLTVSELKFTDLNLRGTDMRELGTFLSNFTVLQSLDLSGNEIGDEQAQSISQ